MIRQYLRKITSMKQRLWQFQIHKIMNIQMLAKGEEIIAGDPIFATLAKED